MPVRSCTIEFLPVKLNTAGACARAIAPHLSANASASRDPGSAKGEVRTRGSQGVRTGVIEEWYALSPDVN